MSTTCSEYSRAYWSAGSRSSIANLSVFGTRAGKYDAAAVLEGQVLAAVRVGLGVVGLDEAARAPHQVQPHQLAPVVGVARSSRRPPAMLGSTWYWPVNSASPISRSMSLRADAQVLVFVHEQPQLRRQVEVGLVVGRGGQQDALASRSGRCTRLMAW